MLELLRISILSGNKINHYINREFERINNLVLSLNMYLMYNMIDAPVILEHHIPYSVVYTTQPKSLESTFMPKISL